MLKGLVSAEKKGGEKTGAGRKERREGGDLDKAERRTRPGLC